MNSVAISGSDTVIINSRVLADFGDGDVASIDYDTDVMNEKVGKDGNSIFSLNNSGKKAMVKLRVLKGSADDKFLNKILSNMLANPAGFVLMTGEFSKTLGDGQGNTSSETYVMAGGAIKRIPGAKSNADGDTGQNISEYSIVFTRAPRTHT